MLHPLKRLASMRKNIRLFSFIALLSLGNLVLFQKPLMSFVLFVSDLPTWQGFAQLASVLVVQFLLLGFLLALISVVSITLLKLVSTVLFVTNSVALYYMQTYNIDIDRSMIGNILNTDTGEAAGLFHPFLLLYVVIFGGLPCLFIWGAKVIKPKWYWRISAAIATFAALLTWLYMTSFTWLWFDQHASRMGSKILPWSYIVNTARHFSLVSRARLEQVLLPDATFIGPEPQGKDIVVLVIGEAARADNFAYYGYDKPTNPFTAATDLIAFPVGLACATNTIAATACILTHEGKDASPFTSFEPLPNYLTRQGVETFYRTNNTGPPPIKATHYAQAKDISAACTDDNCPILGLDGVLNWQLKEAIEASSAARIFIVLHQNGSHGPAYSKKFPPEFAYFLPQCDSVQIANCTPEELMNAYDNTLRYTDFLLADLIAQLSAIPGANAALIYVSDHGQSLGESGFYLHGAPSSIAPKEQLRIPFFVWMSEGFKDSRGLSERDIMLPETFPHDFPFHSVMGAFGMRSDIYKPQFDIFNIER